jgi:poly-gamma-glutamate synthesis protein (capsule biosynthesis protein)
MKRRVISFCLFTLTCLLPPFAAPQGTSSEHSLRLALTGDSIITRKLSVHQEPEFLEMIELIRGADAAFTNIEMLFHDFEFYPMHQSGGTYMRAEPLMAKELSWAGFDLGSLANNHSGDYGVPAMQATRRHVAEAGIVAAGTGDSLMQAREAKFLDTTGGRVALVSVSSRFPDHARASRSHGDNVPARPGLNPLRHTTTYVVTSERLEELRKTAKELGLEATAEGSALTVFGHRFVVGREPKVLTEPHQEDMEEIATVVANAARLAHYVLVSIHGHEGAGDRSVPAEFLVTFCRAMIDAGADVVTGHGPHVLRGIEIYKGKPIFYSLGNFVYQNDTVFRLPQENYDRYELGPDTFVADYFDARYDNDRRGRPVHRVFWEAVIAIPNFKDDALESIELHPISLGFGQPRPDRGRPKLASLEVGEKIIDDLRRLSEPFGTQILYRDGVGWVQLASQTESAK